MSGRKSSHPEGLSIVSLSEVQALVRGFDRLNPYDKTIVRELLKIESVNFDKRGKLRRLLGVAISSKRYALFQRRGRLLDIIEPKAHGLGYLYSPKRERKGVPPWHSDAWGWMLPTILGGQKSEPTWFDRPALMMLVVSTPNVLRKAARAIRPFNFVFYVLVDSSIGYPKGVDREQFTLIAPFNKRRRDWIRLPCLNVHDGRVFRMALKQSPQLDKVIPQTVGALLRRYIDHPEAKALAPDGSRCGASTRGLLARDRVVLGDIQLIGKETDRRWQGGEDISLINSRVPRYNVRRSVKADRATLARINEVGIRETMRRSRLSQHTIAKIRAGRPVRPSTLSRLRDALLGQGVNHFANSRAIAANDEA